MFTITFSNEPLSQADFMVPSKRRSTIKGKSYASDKRRQAELTSRTGTEHLLSISSVNQITHINFEPNWQPAWKHNKKFWLEITSKFTEENKIQLNVPTIFRELLASSAKDFLVTKVYSMKIATATVDDVEQALNVMTEVGLDSLPYCELDLSKIINSKTTIEQLDKLKAEFIRFSKGASITKQIYIRPLNSETLPLWRHMLEDCDESLLLGLASDEPALFIQLKQIIERQQTEVFKQASAYQLAQFAAELTYPIAHQHYQQKFVKENTELATYMQHASDAFGVMIAAQPPAGMGVYAQSYLPRGSTLPYIGERVVPSTVSDDSYMVITSAESGIDAKAQGNWGSRINTVARSSLDVSAQVLISTLYELCEMGVEHPKLKHFALKCQAEILDYDKPTLLDNIKTLITELQGELPSGKTLPGSYLDMMQDLQVYEATAVLESNPEGGIQVRTLVDVAPGRPLMLHYGDNYDTSGFQTSNRTSDQFETLADRLAANQVNYQIIKITKEMAELLKLDYVYEPKTVTHMAIPKYLIDAPEFYSLHLRDHPVYFGTQQRSKFVLADVQEHVNSLTMACLLGNADMIQQLLEDKANPWHLTMNLECAISIILSNKRLSDEQCQHFILQIEKNRRELDLSQATFMWQSPITKQSLFHLAVQHKRYRCLEALRDLPAKDHFAAGKYPYYMEIVDDYGLSAINLAMKNNDHQALDILSNQLKGRMADAFFSCLREDATTNYFGSLEYVEPEEFVSCISYFRALHHRLLMIKEPLYAEICLSVITAIESCQPKPKSRIREALASNLVDADLSFFSKKQTGKRKRARVMADEVADATTLPSI